jgi:hypothetical protein
MGSKHGRRVAFPLLPSALDLQYIPLKTADQVRELLGETINRVRQGRLDLRAANTIGFLAGIHLKALDQRDEEPVGGHKRTENELKAISSLPRTKVEEEVLEHELMRLVVGLDQDKHPKAKLEAIIAAYVVNGKLESGNTRLVIPAEGMGSEAGPGMYTSLFNRLALNAAPGEANAQPAVSYEVRDLYPKPKGEEADSPEGTLPPSGESIDDPPTPSNNHHRILTVEIG